MEDKKETSTDKPDKKERKKDKKKKQDEELKGLSMKERKKVLEERKEKRRRKWYIAIGIVVVVLVAGLLFFDSGVLQRNLPALKVGDKSYSAAELDYYYYSGYNSYSTYAAYYGLDTSKSLKDQEIDLCCAGQSAVRAAGPAENRAQPSATGEGATAGRSGL